MANFTALYMIGRLPLKWLHGYVALSFGIFCYVQGLKYVSGTGSTWVFHYLNDFLTIPMVATICLQGVWFVEKDTNVRLNTFTIVSLVLLFSIYFEYYLPMKSPRFTGDLWDVACYSLGGTVFYFLQKMN